MLVVYKESSGLITGVYGAPESDATSLVKDGEAYLMAAEQVSDATHWVNAGVLTEYSQGAKDALAAFPGDGHDWVPSTGAWIDNRTLETAKVDAWAKIKARREVAFATSAISSVGIAYVITKDKDNLGDRIKSLEAAIAIGAADNSTTATWRDLNNVAHPLTIAGYYLLAAEMGARGQAIYERSWALDAQVQACATKAAIAAIDLEVGWP